MLGDEGVAGEDAGGEAGDEGYERGGAGEGEGGGGGVCGVGGVGGCCDLESGCLGGGEGEEVEDEEGVHCGWGLCCRGGGVVGVAL